MLLRGAAISARQSPFFAKSPPSNLQTPQVRVPASGADGRKARFMRSRENSRLRQSWYLAQGGESLGNLAGSLQGEGEKRDSTAFSFSVKSRDGVTPEICARQPAPRRTPTPGVTAPRGGRNQKTKYPPAIQGIINLRKRNS
jgi:hypothetical protein